MEHPPDVFRMCCRAASEEAAAQLEVRVGHCLGAGLIDACRNTGVGKGVFATQILQL